jgi:hypothetical protein
MYIYNAKAEIGNMRKGIEIESPVRAKDLEGRFHILFKALVNADGSKKELFDTDKMVSIGLKKDTCVVLLDANDRFWELCRSNKGRYSLKRLKEK